MSSSRTPVDVMVDVLCLAAHSDDLRELYALAERLDPAELRASVLAAVREIVPEHIVDSWSSEQPRDGASPG